MAKSILDELTGYRVKVEKDGKEIVNVPGLLALPGMLLSPKLGIAGMIAAPLLGCNIHLENDEGSEVNVGETVKQAADTVIDTARKTARTIREEIDRAWEEMSAEDPEEAEDPEKEAEDAEEEIEVEFETKVANSAAEDLSNEKIVEELEKDKADDVPTIQVDPDDSVG